MALQCPRCELRFDLAPMLADHLMTDHDLPREQTVHLQPPAVRIGLPQPAVEMGQPPKAGAARERADGACDAADRRG